MLHMLTKATLYEDSRFAPLLVVTPMKIELKHRCVTFLWQLIRPLLPFQPWERLFCILFHHLSLALVETLTEAVLNAYSCFAADSAFSVQYPKRNITFSLCSIRSYEMPKED